MCRQYEQQYTHKTNLCAHAGTAISSRTNNMCVWSVHTVHRIIAMQIHHTHLLPLSLLLLLLLLLPSPFVFGPNACFPSRGRTAFQSKLTELDRSGNSVTIPPDNSPPTHLSFHLYSRHHSFQSPVQCLLSTLVGKISVNNSRHTFICEISHKKQIHTMNRN